MTKRIHRDATVHEKTVVKAAANLDEVRQRRPRRKSAGNKNGSVVHITVLPEVWAKALELCGGHPNRIEVVASDNVVVHNGPWRSKK